MSLQPRLFSELVTFARASSGWRFNEVGTFEEVLTDLPRFDFDPVTEAPLGLMMEQGRTNLFLNTATPATQGITVTAVTHTLSFTGSGSVTLSGAATGVLEGTGATDRVTLAFNPSAGTLTLTVAGTIVRPQLEVGAYATSHIPVVGTAVTRAADFAHVLFSDFAYNPSAGTLIVAGDFQEGELILQLNALQIFADETGSKTYTVSYDSTPGGDRIQLGRGTFRSVAYYPTAFGDIAPEDNPLWLFVAGEEGFFNDITTWPTSYFTDTGGTTPAVLENTIALVLDQSGNSTNLTQATAGARPALGQEPITGRRNLLTFTEQLDNPAWTKVNLTTNQIAGEVWEIDEGTATGEHYIRQSVLGNLLPFGFAVEIKAGNAAPWVRLTSRNNNTTNYIDLNLDDESQETNSGAGQSAFINPVFTVTSLSDGWYRLAIRCDGVNGPSANAGVPLAVAILNDLRELSYTGTNRTVLIRKPQSESGNANTDYQRVNSDLNVTEEGVQTVQYLQFDLVDDALVATIPAITGGTLVLATRDGIWIDDDINASAGTFSVGPTTYTGGPAGILSVIGNKLIGPPLLLDRQLTASEKNAVIQWFQSRGAGALYVLGEELITNGTFDSDVSGWSPVDSTISSDAGRLKIVADPGGAGRAFNTSGISVTAGQGYLFSAYIHPDSTLRTRIEYRDGDRFATALYLLTQSVQSGNFSSAVRPSNSSNTVVLVAFDSGSTAYFDNISVRQLTQPGA